MSRSRLCLAVLLMMLSVPVLAAPAHAADPVATTVELVSPTPGTTAYVGQEVTFKVKVTAADGSVPQGTVHWDDAGACMSSVAHAPVESDGTASITYAHTSPYDSYSLNACFFPDDYTKYNLSEDFNCCLKVTTIPTTTVLVSPQPPATAQTGKPVTLTAKVTAADGSVPQGSVHWDDAGACMSTVGSGRVGDDGLASITYTHTSAYDSYSLNACFFPDDYNVYQSSEDFSCCLDVGPVATTTVLVSPQPPATAQTGKPVTLTAKVTAADGSVPQGVVHWDDAGACMSTVGSGRVGDDGLASITYTHTSAYDSYSLNACFFPDDYDMYQSSEDFSCCLDVGPVATTTVRLEPSDDAVARPGQPVTLKAKVTAADGSVPQGVVHWDDAGACMSTVGSGRVGDDGIATVTYTHTSPYDSYSLNACFFPDNYDYYQSSEDFGCCLDVGPVSTTSTITSVTPSSGARTGQPVTMKVSLSAADGSVPQGTVSWQDSGACGSGSPVASSGVASDGTATLTHSFSDAGNHRLRACFAATDAGQYLNSEDDNGNYSVTRPVPDRAPIVSEHPSPRVVVAGRPFSFSAEATGSPSPTVQWQVSRNGGKSWANITGATSKTLSRTAAAGDNGSLYRAVFSNRVGKATTRAAAVLVTHAFRGYSSPAVNASYKPGSTVPVAFTLGGPTGSQLSDATARTVPTSVQLWSPRAALTATATCAYNSSAHQYRCSLKVPAKASVGGYQLLALTRLGSGPWVPAVPVGSAHNPQGVKIAK